LTSASDGGSYRQLRVIDGGNRPSGALEAIAFQFQYPEAVDVEMVIARVVNTVMYEFNLNFTFVMLHRETTNGALKPDA
jgi:hypothetical protein